MDFEVPHRHTYTHMHFVRFKKLQEGFFIKGFCLTLCLPFKSLLTVVYLRLCTAEHVDENLKIKTSSIFASQPFFYSSFFLNYYWSKFIRILCKGGRIVVVAKRKSETLDLFLIFSFSFLSVLDIILLLYFILAQKKSIKNFYPTIAKK